MAPEDFQLSYHLYRFFSILNNQVRLLIGQNLVREVQVQVVKDAAKWNPADFPVKPAITVIYLGENDFSRGRQPSERLFVDDYIRLLREIKDFYGPEHPILCAAPRIEVFEYVRATVDKAGLANVAYTGVFRNNYLRSETGSAGHPAYPAQLKIAHNFIPFVSSLTGWTLQDKVIR